MKHNRLSASKAYQWMACPGSVKAQEGLPDEQSQYSLAGTEAHAYAEEWLRTGVKPKRPFGHTDLAPAVEQYVTAVAGDLASYPGAVLHVEKKLDLDWLHSDLGGTSDAVIDQSFGALIVHDFKSGMDPVRPENNPQQMIYGLGALGPDGGAYENVQIVIDQPRVYDEPQRWNVPPKELLAWGHDVLKPAALKTMDKDAPRVAGDHCKYCKVASTCSALRQLAVTTAGASSDPAMPAVPMFPSVDSLTPDQMRRVYLFSGALENFMKAVRERIANDLRTGRATSKELGIKFVAGRRMRKWVDDSHTARVVQGLGVDPYSNTVLSPAQMEKALKSKGLAVEILEPLITVTQSPTLAPITDRREEIVPAITAFKDIDV